MPRVQPLQQRVAPQATPNVQQQRNTQGAFGQDIAEGLGNVAEVVDQRARQIQEQDTVAKVKSATSQFRKKVNEEFYLSDEGFYRQGGQNAYESYQPAQNRLNELKKEIGADLDPQASRAFGNTIQGYIDSELDAMSRHAAEGRMQWLNQQDEAVLETAQEDGSLRWSQNDVYAEQITATVENLAQRNGWAPEKTELEKEKALTGMHATALDNILVQNPERAQDYFEAHKDSISPNMHDEIQTKINDQVNALWVQSNADEIRLGGGSRTERLERARELTTDDPDRRKELVAQVEHDLQQQKLAENEAQADTYATLTQRVLDGESVTSIRRSDPSAWNRLSGPQRSTLTNASSGGRSETDLGAYYEMTALMADDRDAAREYLLENPSKFSTTDAKGFIDELNEGPQRPANVMTDRAALSNTVEAILGKQPTSGGGRKRWNRMETVLAGVYQDRINRWLESHPNEQDMPHQERQQILDDMVESAVTRKDDLFGIDILNPDNQIDIGDADPEQVSAAVDYFNRFGIEYDTTAILSDVTGSNRLRNIPQRDLQDIVEALNNQGVAPTPETIYAIWEREQ